MRFAVPFDNPTTLRVSLKTLRVIEMSKAASTFHKRIEKRFDKSNVCVAKMQILGIPRIRITAPLSLQRISNAQHLSR